MVTPLQHISLGGGHLEVAVCSAQLQLHKADNPTSITMGYLGLKMRTDVTRSDPKLGRPHVETKRSSAAVCLSSRSAEDSVSMHIYPEAFQAPSTGPQIERREFALRPGQPSTTYGFRKPIYMCASAPMGCLKEPRRLSFIVVRP